MSSTQNYDSIIVGAGHAGVEAALAIARSGYEVLLLTMDTDAISRMSCNPAIGGIAKGHMVREIDALGGEMGLATDATGIQFRMLNRSKGPAVWAPRAQADKKQYSLYMTSVIRNQPRIHLKQAHVVELLVKNGECYGVHTQEAETLLAKTVILTTGTFLQGLIHIGEIHSPGGRTGEKPAVGLSASLKKHGIELIRFKTGTPPRLRADSINWQQLEVQHGDDPAHPFSFRTKELRSNKIVCHITYTTAKTHQIIRENLHRSPLYSGQISGTGPRYCPSIEDKVVKFADKERHQIYLEPEGLDTDSIYVNGMSTSLPEDVQQAFVHSIPGLENAEFLKLAYAIEYDCAPPTQMRHSLETKQIDNLFLAGQINCTSGYEEAAAQGLMAGLNAIRKLRKEEPFVLGRDEAYIGVLIDDLVTRGTNEPYRMFTSRAEFRLLLRQDNADERLMKYGNEFGLISPATYDQCLRKTDRIQNKIAILKKTHHSGNSLHRLLKRPDKSYNSLVLQGLVESQLNPEEERRLEAEVKYEGYITRQRIEIEKFKKAESKQIPPNLDFGAVHGMSREAQEKLSRVRPISIGQASRIPGLSPCDISLLAVHLGKHGSPLS